MNCTDCTAALLCGGKSSRMGFDKARLQDRRGEFLLVQGMEKLGAVFEATALVAAREQDLTGLPGLAEYTLWRDIYPETGPLGAVCTALELAKTPWVFAMACDMPLPDMALARQLYAELDDVQAALFERNGHIEPLFAFYHKSCLPVFQAQLAAGHLRLRDAFSQLRVRMLPFTNQQEEGAFLNLNTPLELAAWQESTGLLQVPQMVMIGSLGRNSGKTTLASALIAHWCSRWPVYGLKVISIDEKVGKCHRGTAGCGLCTAFEGDFMFEEEFGGVPGKDTTRLLQAGAKRVFLLKSKRSALSRAVRAFFHLIPQDGLIICESNSLRKQVCPGVFLLASPANDAQEEDKKPSAQAVAHLADAVLHPQEEKMLGRIRVQTQPQGGLCLVWDNSPHKIV